jgi:hypothetical protein
MATSGAYRVLALVDQTHLQNKIIDRYSKQVLGHTQTVKLPGNYVAATFLDIPANNVAILQRRDDMFVLGAGQHYLTTARYVFCLDCVFSSLSSTDHSTLSCWPSSISYAA